MESLNRYVAVALGGALGAVARYYVGTLPLASKGAPFPTATFIINVSGSFIIGFFLSLTTERIPLSPYLRLAITVGFVGAYTTFSTFEYETARLIEHNEYFYAFLNIALSFVIGLAAVFGGMFVARAFEGMPLTSHVAYDRFEEQADPGDPDQREGVELDIRDSTIVALKNSKPTRRQQG